MNYSLNIYKLENMIILQKSKHVISLSFFIIGLLSSSLSQAQDANKTVRELSDLGFENISYTENNQELTYTLESVSYRLTGVGVNKAISIIQKEGLPQNKSCRVIILDNNVPQISLLYSKESKDSLNVPQKSNWVVSYELGENWKEIKKEKKTNSSLYKVDLLVYPEFSFQNYKLSRVYDILLNFSPAIEVSFWKGMKFTGQIIFPIVNDYGTKYEQIRPGFITLSQSFRLPQRTFLTASAGFFNNFRWGMDARAKHFLRDERFSLEARLAYTGKGEFDNWAFYHGKEWTFTGNIGANFYWPLYNTQFSLKAERYLEEELGVRFDMIRHFRHASVGFYAMKVEHAGNNGFNGGLRFQIALPPYKYKRNKYVPRVMPSSNFGIGYNAGNERVYGKTFKSQASDNIMQDNGYNPYFIKSELND